ncbi:hypothetical protein EDB81DRAFT_932079 [Dactylonectria macrodidyma]|uniref:NAD(P)-binding domain-containing protein n=1 Tax=Dactylonectria macrodidyma TaxID=307937 RepID=A0A9P9F630_9HYPO|nr:hypothetical protein EDB81DRAFT_932079 [Dactylonectria macrodidyma]
MAIIAVAGGTGGIGRALVDAITSRGKHEVKILSRKANDSLAKEIGVPVIAVDYSDVEELTRVFEKNNIDTVISALFTMPVAGVAPEVCLIQAAQGSKPTRRFIPSNWGLPLDASHQEMTPSVPMKLRAAAELQRSDLEHTVFYPGFLLDYYTGSSIKSYMSPLIVVIDMEHNMAAIPGSGNTPIAFTHSLDIGRYVDAALDLEKWDSSYRIVGDKSTWNDFVKSAQAAKGTPFTIIHDSVEDLKKGRVTILPAVEKYLHLMSVPNKEVLSQFLGTFGQLFADGSFNIKEEGALNEMFPEIKPLTIKEAVEAAAKAT